MKRVLVTWSPRGQKIFIVIFTLFMVGLIYFMVRQQAQYDLSLKVINVHFEQVQQGNALPEHVVSSTMHRQNITKIFKGAKSIALNRVKTVGNRRCVYGFAKTDASSGTGFWALLERADESAEYKVVDMSRWHQCICDHKICQIKSPK